MRGLSIIAAMWLLASCGGGQGGNASDAAPDTPEAAPEAANAAADGKPAVAEASEPAANAAAGVASPCLVQGTEQLEVKSLRATGTEPFWSARVEGRCVTYSTPDNQQGTRVWTRYSAGGGGRGTWTGQLDGRLFEMRTRPEPGCSDGMSDKRYPIAVELTVGGEQRRGCAEEL